MNFIEIDEIKAKLGSYNKLANLVDSGQLQVCYKVNNFVASVDAIEETINSIQFVNEFFIAETCEDLRKLITNEISELNLFATKDATTIKHPNHSINRWVFLENNRHTHLLQNSLIGGKKLHEAELIPNDERYFDTDKFFNYGSKKITRDSLFITSSSWNNYCKNPKTKDAIDRHKANNEEDLYNVIYLLKHIICETENYNQDKLTSTLNSLAQKEAHLNRTKLSKIFKEANNVGSKILIKNKI